MVFSKLEGCRGHPKTIPEGPRGPPKPVQKQKNASRIAEGPRSRRNAPGSPKKAAAAWALLEASGRLLSRFRRPLGRSGALLAALGRLLGRSWRLLNGSWSALGGAEVGFGQKAENRGPYSVFGGFNGLQGASLGTTVRANTSFLTDKAVSLHDSWSDNRHFARQFERKRRSQGRREVAGLAEVKSGQFEQSSM